MTDRMRGRDGGLRLWDALGRGNAAERIIPALPIRTAWFCAGGRAACSRVSTSLVTLSLGAGGIGTPDRFPLCAGALAPSGINRNCACRPSCIVRILFKASLQTSLVCSSAARRSAIRKLTRGVADSRARPQSLVGVSRRSSLGTDDVDMTGDKKDSVCCGWCAAAVGSGGKRSSFCHVPLDYRTRRDTGRGSRPMVPPVTNATLWCTLSDRWKAWAILILRDQRQS